MRVLLVRLDGIGDAAVCAPLLLALRDAGHEVGIASTTRNAGLFVRDALLAEHVLERIPWPAHGSTPESTTRARAEVVSQRYDVALIASEEPEAFALAAGIPRRIGFSTGWTRPLKSLWVRARTTSRVPRMQRAGAAEAHEVEVLYRLGVAASLVAGAPPADPARLRALFTGEPPPERGRDVVVQAGPKWEASGVPAPLLRAALGRLSASGARVVAAPGEVSAVRAALGVEPETFADLRAWVALLDRALCVVTVDSGAAHVAGMLGTPVVDVFPDAHVMAQVARWRPWAAPYRALRASDVRGGGGAPLVEAVLDGV